MALASEIQGVSRSEYAIGALYIALIAMIFADIAPTPADALYFSYERKLRNQYIKKEIAPRQYWVREAGAYYLLNPIWWFIVLLIVVNIKGDVRRKLRFALIIIGAGMVFGVLMRNIRLDVKEMEKDIEEHRKKVIEEMNHKN